MTLILTQLSKYGIIHASDSNISNERGELLGEGRKVFEIPHLNAGLSVAGSYFFILSNGKCVTYS